MKKNKPEIVFTFSGVLGGVSSFNYNIINHSTLISKFYSKVILLKEVADNRALFTERFHADEEIIFEYSDKENQFHLQKRLNELFGNDAGAIVTDNGLTVEAARRFNNHKTVFNLIHDYYYVNQQVKLGDWVDAAVAHSSFFSDAVFSSDPLSFSNRSFYIPYGVKQLSSFPEKEQGNLNLVFLGRIEEAKGVMRLFEINKELKKQHIKVNWTIIGKGSLKNELLKQWEGEQASFPEPSSTQAVYDILSTQDVFVFPTMFEGTPVAILECLSNAVVPLVNDLPGGIRDIVKSDIGFRCESNDVSEYVKHISELNRDRPLLQKMQRAGFDLARKTYDVDTNADNYFRLFLRYEELARKTKHPARILTKLDRSVFPAGITKLIRSLR